MKVFTGNTMHGVFDTLLPQFERETGHRVQVVYDPAQIILKRVKAGETGDLAIVGEGVLDELIASGKIDGATRRTIARCGVGVGVKKGAPKPNVSSVDELKRTLVKAKSIAYTTSGASGLHFQKLIERFGIANQVKQKGITRPGGLIGELVARGEAEICIQQIPEIQAVHGVELVAPLPGDAQNITTSAAGIFVGAAEAEAAHALISYLTTPAAAKIFQATGLEPA